jgi:dihydropyrimidinase
VGDIILKLLSIKRKGVIGLKKILLKGGTVVSGEKAEIADVLIEGERIKAVGNLFRDSEEIILDNETIIKDMSGRLIFPGFIDGHTHFDLHVAGTVTADDFESGTKSAVMGGTTTIVDFATQYEGESLTQAFENWSSKAENSVCDYRFHMAITDWNEDVKKELKNMLDRGINSFKLYTTYDTMVSDEEIYDILIALKEVGGIAGVHCEDDAVISKLVDEAKKIGEMGVSSHPNTRPKSAEVEAVRRILDIAYRADSPIIIVHLTCKESLEEVEKARLRGQEVYVETCPHYLLLDASKYDLDGFEGAKYVCSPPLRTAEDEETLWSGIAGGRIQTVATDHCSFTVEQKKIGESDFTKIPGGMPGVQDRVSLVYSFGVEKERINLMDMCRVLSENPAKLYGIYPKKGAIKVGSDADITVLKPCKPVPISYKDEYSKAGYTPFEGMEITVQIESVYLRGTEVVNNRKLTTNITSIKGRYVGNCR